MTCDDFAQAIADANPDSALAKLLPQFKRWYSQAGTPRVSARGRYDAPSRTYTLGIEQTALPSPGQPAKQAYVIPLAMGLVGRDGQALPLQLEGETEAVGTERVCWCSTKPAASSPSSMSTWSPCPRCCVASRRRWCWPTTWPNADLLTLLQHDPDPFNRWEAGQRLALSRLLAGVKDSGPVQLDSAFIEAMRSVLRHPELDAAFKELAPHAAERNLRGRAAQPGRPAAHPRSA